MPNKSLSCFLLYLFYYIYALLSTHVHVHQTRLFGKHAFIYHNNLARALIRLGVGTDLFYPYSCLSFSLSTSKNPMQTMFVRQNIAFMHSTLFTAI
jgi:hypothetical protein